tara:strand:+ start:685 stop:2352 length:1668 start_codon:yes stop_codon:yes gene_type:complete
MILSRSNNAYKTPTFAINGLFILQLVCLFILAYTPSSPSYSDDSNSLEEWHYTLRPGDTLQDISLSLLSHKYSWSDVIKHNRVDKSDMLAPGSIIKIPMHWLKQQPKPAKVKTLDGMAQIKKARSTRYETLKADMLIQVGDEVATRNGNLVIEFADNSTIRLEANSNLFFNKLSHFGKTGMVDTRLRLKNGSLTTDIPPLVKGSRYEIKTPSAVAAVRGTEFRLHSSENETRLEVLEGSVEFSGEHGQTMVKAGKGASIKSGSPRIEVIDLPSPPRAQLAQDTIRKLPINVEWDKSKNAKAYQVQISQKDKNGRIVQDKIQQDNTMAIDQINNGDYELAIRSIDENGYKSGDSISKLSVEIDLVKAQLITPVEADIITNTKPSFSWNYAVDDTLDKDYQGPLSRLDIAIDKEFAALITDNEFTKINQLSLKQPLIPNRYFWRVATLNNNTQLSFSETRMFHIKGWLAPVQILSVNYLDKQVGLFWSPVANAEGYILQISNQSDFSTILKEEKLDKPRAHLLLNENQQYYARVKGIGNKLYSSKFGPVQEVFITPK